MARSTDTHATVSPVSIDMVPAERTLPAADNDTCVASAPAPEVAFIRGDGAAAWLSSAKQPDDLLSGRKMPSKLRRFYKTQNDMIDVLISDMEAFGSNGGEGATISHDGAALVRAAVSGSFALNVALTIAKIIATVSSGSMSALASAADSLLDLVSGGVLFLTQRAMSRTDPYKYPEGKARLEPLGVIVFAVVMGMSSVQIIVEAVKRIVTIATEGPSIELGPITVIILGSTIVFKLVAMLFCQYVAKKHNSTSVDAYAQDHRNDVLTNTVGVVAVVLAAWQPDYLALLDPIGAVIIALWIIASWLSTAMEQMSKLAGLTAPPDFVRRLTHIVFTHDTRVQKVDTCRAYHFGERFLVEVEIVMRPDTPLKESHDVGITLQHKIERLEEVERAFVHIDYQVRDVDDHDTGTPITRKTATDAARLRGAGVNGESAALIGISLESAAASP